MYKAVFHNATELLTKAPPRERPSFFLVHISLAPLFMSPCQWPRHQRPLLFSGDISVNSYLHVTMNPSCQWTPNQQPTPFLVTRPWTLLFMSVDAPCEWCHHQQPPFFSDYFFHGCRSGLHQGLYRTRSLAPREISFSLTWSTGGHLQCVCTLLRVRSVDAVHNKWGLNK